MRTNPNHLLPWYVSLELVLHDYASGQENVLQRDQLLPLLLWLFGSDVGVLGGGMLETWWRWGDGSRWHGHGLYHLLSRGVRSSRIAVDDRESVDESSRW